MMKYLYIAILINNKIVSNVVMDHKHFTLVDTYQHMANHNKVNILYQVHISTLFDGGWGRERKKNPFLCV